jgi:hypothetical protein
MAINVPELETIPAEQRRSMVRELRAVVSRIIAARAGASGVNAADRAGG